MKAPEIDMTQRCKSLNHSLFWDEIMNFLALFLRTSRMGVFIFIDIKVKKTIFKLITYIQKSLNLNKNQWCLRFYQVSKAIVQFFCDKWRYYLKVWMCYFFNQVSHTLMDIEKYFTHELHTDIITSIASNCLSKYWKPNTYVVRYHC